MKTKHLVLNVVCVAVWFATSAQVDQGLDPLWFTNFSGPMLTTPSTPVDADAVAVSGSFVYVGGGFTSFAGHSYKRITRWDGVNWVQVGGGLNGRVRSLLTASNGDVYVGGDFTATEGGLPVNHIAKWNGTSWSALGGGVSYYVHSMVFDNDGNLFVGGATPPSGGNGVHKWDGNTWTDIGGVVNSTVYIVAHNGTTLFAGGFFTSIDGVSTNQIAAWDGSDWSSLDGGITTASGDRILGMTTLNDDLYVVGNFTSIGGVAATNIAKWDGTDWSPLGAGLPSIEFSVGTTPDGKILAKGGGYTPGQYSTVGLWDGTAWSQTGITVSAVSGFAYDGNITYIAGAFGIYGSDNGDESYFLSGITKTIGSTAYPMTEDLSNPADAVAVSGSDIYVAGKFKRMDGQDEPFNSIAKWDGNAWSRLGNGITNPGGSSGVISAMVVEGSKVYVTGYIPSGLQIWDGTSWSGAGQGLQGLAPYQPRALVVKGGQVYVGGSMPSFFSSFDVVTCNNIAMWDGVKWNTLAGGLNGRVNALAFDGDDLYAGGEFTKSGNTDMAYFARWDGEAWHAVDNGLDGPVRSIVIRGDDIYLAGEFTHAGGLTVNRIAKWNSSFSALGAGMDNTVTKIALAGPHLFAVGDFQAAGGASAVRIARWDGSNWSRTGAGLRGPYVSSHYVSALAVSDFAVYAGGNFMEAGSRSSAFLAGLHTDSDGDLVADVLDNCPNHANPGQANADGDTSGAACDCNENDDQVTAKVWFLDTDGDGAGRTDEKMVSCTQPPGYVSIPADCDDQDANRKFPTTFYVDADGDGFGNPDDQSEECFRPAGFVENDDDCDDSKGGINPNTIWYKDTDGDGFGNATVTQTACLKPAGFVSNNTDCDDTKADVNPNTEWRIDADGDGRSTANAAIVKSCTNPGAYTRTIGDCNDADPAIYNGAPKLPNGKDNDCDGAIDLFDQVLTFPAIADRTIGIEAVSFAPVASSNAPGAVLKLESVSTHIAINFPNVQVLSPGSVTLKLKSDAFLGWKAAEATQTFCIKPAKPVASTTSGETISLSSTLLSDNRWFRDGVVIAGATGVSFSPTEPGVYKVRGEVEGCVGEFSNEIPIIVTGLARTDGAVAFYPNPVEDVLFIDTGVGEYAISVYGLDGREIRRARSNGNAEISMKEAAYGMYLLKVTGEQGVLIARFQKQ